MAVNFNFRWSEASSSLSFLDSRSCLFVTYHYHLYGKRKSGWYQCDVEDFKRMFANSVFRHDVSYINLTLTFDDQNIRSDEVWIYRRGWWYHIVVE